MRDDAHWRVRHPGATGCCEFDGPRARTRMGKRMSRGSLVRPFHEAKMVLLVLGFMCLTFGVFNPINYIVVQAVDAGMSCAGAVSCCDTQCGESSGAIVCRGVF